VSACPSREELDALAAGAGTPTAAAHASACGRCARRVSWLRREAGLVRRWAALDDAPTAHLWEGVRQRIAARRRRKWAASAGAGALMAVAAFAGLQAMRRIPPPQAPPSASAAIDRAEADYGRAIEALEAQVAARSPDPKRALARAHGGISRARSGGGRDPASRVRVLEGYAAYLRSLRRALRETQ
jgi:hypothetical protein